MADPKQSQTISIGKSPKQSGAATQDPSGSNAGPSSSRTNAGQFTWDANIERYLVAIPPGDAEISHNSSIEVGGTSGAVVGGGQASLNALKVSVLHRDWITVHDSLGNVLDPERPFVRNAHPNLYAIIYREQTVDLIIQGKYHEAMDLSVEVDHLTDAPTEFSISEDLQAKVSHIKDIAMRKVDAQATDSEDVWICLTDYCRLYSPEVIGHNRAGRSDLWDFAVVVPKEKEQPNPNIKCLACGKIFTNCTIAVMRKHLDERKKDPSCPMLTGNMRERFAVGESGRKGTNQPQPGHGGKVKPAGSARWKTGHALPDQGMHRSYDHRVHASSVLCNAEVYSRMHSKEILSREARRDLAKAAGLLLALADAGSDDSDSE